MSKKLGFDDRVAIITGAGGGLGRAYALLLASRGAKVVVNDLGGSHTGEGSSQNAADKVVDEIRAAGGQAVANYDSVEHGDKIIKTAVDAYNRVDIVVNNAGILRDTSFHKMTLDDWQLIFKVHMWGSFRVTHAVWPILREQGYGRIIMTASSSGIYGNFGQANYSAAKLGLLGLSNTLAIEGRKRNIFCNTIAPVAGSRMTETVLPPNLIDALKPKYVAPLVAYLCHEDCQDTGGLYEVGGGFFAKLRWERAAGKLYRVGRELTPEMVAESWETISSFAKSTHPENSMASFQPVMQNVEAGPSQGGNRFIDVDQALGYQYPEVTNRYDERDLALYALGVGAASDPGDQGDLQLVYERHGKGMRALPTYGVIPALNAQVSLLQEGKQAPGLKYGLERLLHGEQYTELIRPLPTKATLSHKARIKNIFDKGKHALIITEIITYDEDGNRLARNESTSLIRGAGGWGGERGPSQDVNVPPERAPDKTIEEVIPENQALLYRLSGDWNPLHADPGFAKAAGFDKPILHGLCTFGYAGRHVVQSFAPGGDPGYFKSIKTRFSDSVFPGETLITEMWKESDTRIVFRCRIKERDSVVISNAAIELFSEIPKPAPKAKAKAAPAAKQTPTSGDIFRAMGVYIGQNAGLADKVKTVFLFKLGEPESAWTIDLKNSPPSVSEGESQAQCTLQMSDGDFMDMATGKADPMKLFSTGKLRISGDVMASQKLDFMKNVTPDMVIAEMKKRLGKEAGGTESAGEGSFEPTSWDVFVAIRDHMKRNPDLVDRVGHVFLFQLSDPESVWTLDMKAAPGAVIEGQEGTPDCTLAISEADFMAMTRGQADPMTLFSTGKLRISGNVMASQKLEFLQKIDMEQAKAAVLAARKAGGPGKKAPAKAADKREPQAPAIFAALAKRLADKPELLGEIGTSLQVRIGDPQAILGGADPEAYWLIESAGDQPVREVWKDGTGAVLTISDSDLTALVRGEAHVQDLYQRGKLRMDGEVSAAQRLGFLKGLI